MKKKKNLLDSYLNISQKESNTKIKCSRIVAFGDSMTAGAETLDYLHPLYKKKRKWSMEKWFREYIKYPDIVMEIKEKQRNSSWPNYLAKILDLPVCNLGVGGGSLENICVALLTEQFKPSDNDLILVGLPPVGRYIWFSLRGMINMNPDFFSTTGKWSEYRVHKETLINFYTDDKFIWDYICQLNLLQHYKNTRWKNLFVIAQWNDPFDLNQFSLSKELKPGFQEQVDKLRQSDLFLNSNWNCRGGISPGSYEAYGHPDRSMQFLIAKRINQWIYRDLND